MSNVLRCCAGFSTFFIYWYSVITPLFFNKHKSIFSQDWWNFYINNLECSWVFQFYLTFRMDGVLIVILQSGFDCLYWTGVRCMQYILGYYVGLCCSIQLEIYGSCLIYYYVQCPVKIGNSMMSQHFFLAFISDTTCGLLLYILAKWLSVAFSTCFCISLELFQCAPPPLIYHTKFDI